MRGPVLRHCVHIHPTWSLLASLSTGMGFPLWELCDISTQMGSAWYKQKVLLEADFLPSRLSHNSYF